MRLGDKRGSFLIFRRRSKNIASLLEQTLSKEMLNDPLLVGHVKTEDYLMVALGVRSCASITIPAEFPDGNDLGKRIDELCMEDFHALSNASPDRKRALIVKLKKKELAVSGLMFIIANLIRVN